MNPAQDHVKHLVLMLTYSCNLHCTYCYERHQGGKTMSVAQALTYIKKGFDDAVQNTWYQRLEIIFMGGEPLLEWKNICQIVENVESHNDWPLPYHFFSATNGTLLTKEMKEWIEPRKDYFILGISTDGNSDMQNSNRSNSASTIDLAYYARTWPRQAPKFTISHYTLPHIKDGIIFLYGKGFKGIQANLALGQTWQPDDLKIYADQLRELTEFYLLNPDIERCSLLNLSISSCLNLTGEKRKYCGCGEVMTCVDIDGVEYPCQMFAPITLSPETVKIAQAIDFHNHENFMNESCAKCLFNLVCPRCYGISFKNHSDVKYQESFMCKAFKIQFLANCNLQEKLIAKGLETGDKTKLTISVIEFVKKYLFNNNTLNRTSYVNRIVD